MLAEQKAPATTTSQEVSIEDAKWGDDDIELDEEEVALDNEQIVVGTTEEENNMQEVKLGLSLGTQKSEQQRKGEQV